MSYTVTRGFITAAFDTAESAATYITEHITEDYYDAMLDECYAPVEICGYEYMPSVALRRCDETAYRCGYNDYCDSLYSDIEDTINRMEAGVAEELYGFAVQREGEE